mmetsp:Transcript_4816/g.10208  ORF Transcript_4816/g.10208 Transcript_4816/m.10208 type:complete len:304 (-) Transcript_4816:589-1500(-)
MWCIRVAGPAFPENSPCSLLGLMLTSKAPSSCATASTIIVFPAPAGPYSITDFTHGFPSSGLSFAFTLLDPLGNTMYSVKALRSCAMDGVGGCHTFALGSAEAPPAAAAAAAGAASSSGSAEQPTRLDPATSACGAAGAGGSVWNSGGTWEEKDCSEWAKASLKGFLKKGKSASGSDDVEKSMSPEALVKAFEGSVAGGQARAGATGSYEDPLAGVKKKKKIAHHERTHTQLCFDLLTRTKLERCTHTHTNKPQVSSFASPCYKHTRNATPRTEHSTHLTLLRRVFSFGSEHSSGRWRLRWRK